MGIWLTLEVKQAIVEQLAQASQSVEDIKDRIAKAFDIE